jgi:hypothetical protein
VAPGPPHRSVRGFGTAAATDAVDPVLHVPFLAGGTHRPRAAASRFLAGGWVGGAGPRVLVLDVRAVLRAPRMRPVPCGGGDARRVHVSLDPAM